MTPHDKFNIDQLKSRPYHSQIKKGDKTRFTNCELEYAYARLHFNFPPPALSGSGYMGVISAFFIKAPLNFEHKDMDIFNKYRYFSLFFILNARFLLQIITYSLEIDKHKNIIIFVFVQCIN